MQRRLILKTGLAGLALAGSGGLGAATQDCGSSLREDPNPLEGELEKYPRCAHCGMDRRKFHYSRALVRYQDNLVEGTCSIHCLAVSLVKNLGKEAQALHIADYGSPAEPRPLTEATRASFIVGGEFPRVMSKRPKTAFADPELARQAQAEKGGELVSYDQALLAAYTDLAEALKTRRERRREQQPGS